MAFNVNEFRSRFQHSSPALFEVLVFTPPALTGLMNAEQFRFSCRSVAFPSRVITTEEYRDFGPAKKTPFDRRDENLSLTVYCGNKFQERTLFEKWFDLIYSNDDFLVSYGSDLKSLVNIVKYDQLGKVEAFYAFEKAFPTMLSSMQFDWEATDQITTFTVDFEYLKWNRLA